MPDPNPMTDRSKLVREIAEVLNRNSAENGSNTPDFLLAEYLVDCLVAFSVASRKREKWYGKQLVVPAGVQDYRHGDAEIDKRPSNA